MQETIKRASSLLAVLLALLLAQASSAQDMPLSQVLIDDQPWQLVGEGYQFTEGPAVTGDGTVYFTDVPANMIYRIGDDGKPEVFIDNSDRTSGLMFGPLGLYGCSSASRSILLFDADGKKSPLARGVTSNDLVVTGKGAISKEFPFWIEKSTYIKKYEPTSDGGCWYITMADYHRPVM